MTSEQAKRHARVLRDFNHAMGYGQSDVGQALEAGAAALDTVLARLQPLEGEQKTDQGAGLAAVANDTTVVPTPQLPHVDPRVEYKCKDCGTTWGPLSAPAKCPTCGRFSHGPSHLDHESPKFKGKPHIWIQWKGTDVCCDIHCTCGAHCHFDGDFLYCFQCPHCERYWEVGTHMPIYEVPKERAESCCQSVDRDDDWQPPIGSVSE